VTELSDAIASRREHGGLSPAERAAAETDLHMSTCDEPRIDDCGDCQVKLARIRRLVDAVRPVVEREERDRRAVELAERLRLTRLAGPEFAPYPLREEDVTAEGLACHLAAQCQWLIPRMDEALHQVSRTTDRDRRDDKHAVWSFTMQSFVAKWAVVYLLRELPSVEGDRLARAIWCAWSDGAHLGETVWEWLTEWGIDPERLRDGVPG
jgi:hypothetical protein